MNYLFPEVSLLRKVISYIVPVTIAHRSGKRNPYLEIILYRNQWQLATEDALYSDGYRYLPFRMAFRKIPYRELTQVKECLVLGAGLGSIPLILFKKYSSDATYTLVEYDNIILDWAVANLHTNGIDAIDTHCMDARDFVENTDRQYDLVCIDIFSGREVPESFTKYYFFRDSKQILKPGGIWIMNYIVNDDKEFARFLEYVKALFPEVMILQKGPNRILISHNN